MSQATFSINQHLSVIKINETGKEEENDLNAIENSRELRDLCPRLHPPAAGTLRAPPRAVTKALNKFPLP